MLLATGWLLLGGCRRGAQIALIPPTTGVPLWDAAHAGAVRGARGCGLQVHYNGPPREDDLQGQLALFQRSIQAHAAGIILAPIQAQALRNPVQRAISDGVPVVVIGADLGIRGDTLSYVLNDEGAGGRIAASTLGDLLHGEGTVVVLGLDVHQAVSLEREAAFEEAIAQRYPRIHIVQRLSGFSNLAEDEEAAHAVLTSPRKVDAIVALDAISTRGAYYAEMSEPRPRPVLLLGFDQDLIPPVREGKIAAIIAERTHEIGRRAAEAVCARVQGKPYPNRVVVPPLLLTPENINSSNVALQLDRDWWDESGS